tara:strand:+ start:2160 stop:2975 length:816 start_codon:yes stop_codon:yes gene_type:complete
MFKKIVRLFITRKQFNSLKNSINTFISYFYLVLSKLTKYKLYRNVGYNYHLPDSGMGSFKPFVNILLDNFEIKKNIIEIGIGFNSTPLFTNIVDELNNISSFHFENNIDWFTQIKNKYSTKNSKFIFFKESDLKKAFEQNNINKNSYSIAFIDSNPWETRTFALNYLKEISDIIIVHDSAFFPENNIWGNNIKKIEFIPESRYWYGKLDKSKTGEKNYDEVFKFWIEIYPEYPGHFSGPPTLFGSQKIDVAKLFVNQLSNEVHFFNGYRKI